MVKETLISLYGGRSAGCEISVLPAESVIRAISYGKFSVKTYFITQSGDFVKTQEFSSRPAGDEKLMTSVTIVESQKIKSSDIHEEEAVVFPILHGPVGEDGSIQGFLEIFEMPYAGTNILSSGVAMDKISTGHVFESASVPLVIYVTYIEGADLERAAVGVNKKLTYSVSVEPANMGPLMGIPKADDGEGLRPAIDPALKYNSRILIETGVSTREIKVEILGNTDVRTTLSGKVVRDTTFYDYNARYIDNKITMDISAHVDGSIMEETYGYAATVFYAVGGCDLSCCDLFLIENGHAYLNELNTIPGFTRWSMYPFLWENTGLTYPGLIEKLVELIKEIFEKRESHSI